MKKISELLDVSLDINILGITDDSREVENGFLFIATKGFNVDHYDYIEDAIKRGAVFIVTDRKISFDIPNLVIESDINKFYSECCRRFYDVNMSDYSLIGITGTDGKTTTSTIISRILDDTAYMGTNGMIINSYKYSTDNTTPCINKLYDLLGKIRDNNCHRVAMEVSSEALLHKRIDDFKFDVIGYTNITEDHLNVHKTIEKYRECKFELSKHINNNGVVFVNKDDKNCQLLKCQNMSTYGFDKTSDYVITDVKNVNNKVCFSIVNGNNIYEIVSPLIGDYNIYNVTLAFIVGLYYKIPSAKLIEKIKSLTFIDGRRELLDFGQKYEIILDYAHTYNGIKNILDSVDSGKKKIVVTGCAGGREKEKREKIGKLILDNSDLAILTMDDPRNEDVNEIIDQMVNLSTKDYLRIIDRKEAIYEAFRLADENTVVLILGKGRDNYMAIGNSKIDYCDFDVIKNYFIKGN